MGSHVKRYQDESCIRYFARAGENTTALVSQREILPMEVLPSREFEPRNIRLFSHPEATICHYPFRNSSNHKESKLSVSDSNLFTNPNDGDDDGHGDSSPNEKSPSNGKFRINFTKVNSEDMDSLDSNSMSDWLRGELGHGDSVDACYKWLKRTKYHRRNSNCSRDEAL